MQTDLSRESLYKDIEQIIIEQCDLSQKGINEIHPTDNLMSDIGIESVDFLVVIFEIEDNFSIKVPMEAWMQQASSSGSDAKANYKMSIFVDNIYGLIKK